MTREELFRAVGQVREDQAAEAVKKQPSHWRRYGTLAACLAVVLTAGFAVSRLRPAGIDEGGTGLIEDSGLDGSEYSTPESTPEDAAVKLRYSVNVEWSELAVEGTDPRTAADKETVNSDACCFAWLEPEEILAADTAIFRGVVRNLRCGEITDGSYQAYYTIASVEITDCVRGELGVGDIYNILYTGLPGQGTSVSGDLKNLEVGSDAIFMPYWTNPEAGWVTKDSFFAYMDLAELYFDEGFRYLFLDTGEGLSFERTVYADIADAETLDEVMDYLRANVPNADRPPETEAEIWEAAGESAQPARIPVEPQPSATAEAPENPENETDNGPAGAGELPGGALVSGEGDGWEIAICGGDPDSDHQVGEPNWNDAEP